MAERRNKNDGAETPSAENHSILPSRSPERSQRHRNAVRLIDYWLTALRVRGNNIVYDIRNVSSRPLASGTSRRRFLV
jgi:hypothetical protein